MTTSIYYQSNIIDTEADAALRLQKLVEFDSIPTLSADDIQQLLDDHKVATIWTASTTYRYGDRVIPTQPNRTGHLYQNITNTNGATSGVSGTVEPLWPPSGIEIDAHWHNFVSRTIYDGTILWRECGPEENLWNIRRAAEEGWARKVGKAATMFDTKISNDAFFCSQVQAHCKDMLQAFADVDGIA